MYVQVNPFRPRCTDVRGRRSATAPTKEKKSRSEERLLKPKTNSTGYDCLRRSAINETKPPKPAKASVVGSGIGATVNA